MIRAAALLIWPVLFLTGGNVPGARASSQSTALCAFNNVQVPCARLARSVSSGGIDPVRLKYKFEKYAALWPNSAIYGKPHPAVEIQDRSDFYNRVVTRSPRSETIENKELATEIFDERFVDSTLPAAHRNRSFKAVTNSKLVSASNSAYRGLEVFGLWQASLSKAAICSQASFDDDGFPARECARTRRTSDGRGIEYCTYVETEQGRVQSRLQCLITASENGAEKFVLATQYPLHDLPEGAGGEQEMQCLLPDYKGRDGATAIKSVIDQFLSTTTTSRQNMERFKAVGLSLRDEAERIYVRAALNGRLSSSAAKDSYVVIPDTDIKKHPDAPLLAMNWSFTISPRATDDITDYREPSEEQGKRVQKNFLKSFAVALRRSAPQAICVVGAI